MVEEDSKFKLIVSPMADESFATMDLCEYYNKILGISVCSDFSNEENMIRNSVYKTS